MMRFLVLALLALVFVFPAQAQTQTNVEPMDLYRLAMVTDPQVSPSGSQVLFTRTTFDVSTDRRQGELWLLDVGKGNDQRLLVASSGRPGGARWSPDGKRIAYVAEVAGKPQIHVLALAEGVGRPVTQGALVPTNLAWSPDGQTLAFTAQVDAPPARIAGMPTRPEGATWATPARIIDQFSYRADEGGWRTPGAMQIFTVGAAGGKPQQLTQGATDQVLREGRLAFTPDGKTIIYAANVRPDANLRPREADLYAIPVAGGAPRQITTREGLEADPVVSSDGKTIAFTGFAETPKFYAMPRIWAVPLAGGTPVEISTALDRPAQAATWTPDSRAVQFLFNDVGITRVGQVAATGGAVRTLVPQVGGTRLYLPSSGGSYSSASGVIAANSLYADRPAGLAVYRGTKRIAEIDLNRDWRAGKRIGKLEEIRYTSSADGKEIQGWIQYPPDFDPAKRYPLALEIHGGPNTDYGPMFSITHQLYAAAGYIVLFTNPRGSIGYGEAFANAIDGAYPGQDHDDLMSGVDALLKRPYVDANNLFIGGGSGGGVLTGWAIGKTNRFKAAAMLRPVTDWTVQALTSDIQSLTARYWLQGMPWERQAHYWALSPLSLVGQLQTPTILITGEADFRTPISQTESYFQALQLRGIPARMVRLPEAPHGMGRPSQWLASNLAVIEWYERFRSRP
jgi:dipeptidyl aminopeptidase/acylaminoacyl peptidase